MDGIANSAAVGSCLVCTRQQLNQLRARTTRAVSIADTMAAKPATQMLAQQLTAAGIKKPHVHRLPLHVDLPPDPARRRSVVGSFNFDTAIQMNRALAILVVAERLQRRRLQK